MKTTITITFGEQAENHVGMQKIGTGLSDNGYSLSQLQNFQNAFGGGELLELGDDAAILIIRDGINKLMEHADYHSLLFEELDELVWDTKAFMYGRVVNKKARHNLVFDNNSQEPDYDNKKGRIYAWSEVPLLLELKNELEKILNDTEFTGEGNKYYNPLECGIGWHGDAERKKVVAVRIGAPMKLQYRWYLQHKPVSDVIDLTINGGDIYIMSEKATGYDWKQSSKRTLRHRAGGAKFLAKEDKKNS